MESMRGLLALFEVREKAHHYQERFRTCFWSRSYLSRRVQCFSKENQVGQEKTLQGEISHTDLTSEEDLSDQLMAFTSYFFQRALRD
jgi:hypothetical protein